MFGESFRLCDNEVEYNCGNEIAFEFPLGISLDFYEYICQAVYTVFADFATFMEFATFLVL